MDETEVNCPKCLNIVFILITINGVLPNFRAARISHKCKRFVGYVICLCYGLWMITLSYKEFIREKNYLQLIENLNYTLTPFTCVFIIYKLFKYEQKISILMQQLRLLFPNINENGEMLLKRKILFALAIASINLMNSIIETIIQWFAFSEDQFKKIRGFNFSLTILDELIYVYFVSIIFVTHIFITGIINYVSMKMKAFNEKFLRNQLHTSCGSVLHCFNQIESEYFKCLRLIEKIFSDLVFLLLINIIAGFFYTLPNGYETMKSGTIYTSYSFMLDLLVFAYFLFALTFAISPLNENSDLKLIKLHNLVTLWSSRNLRNGSALVTRLLLLKNRMRPVNLTCGRFFIVTKHLSVTLVSGVLTLILIVNQLLPQK